ncbi:M16 family metallopeptidase [Halalkalibacter nanhaiisediminis]|uniref:Putative Zn-dependent peptidase n=1 Tax=Halalkalibacter nanhaiisediminis TaxID=688079 RepID=A0A562QES3_9BACI|nr:pitrilysin family protein [Halalkalibacter nanhaiisediminis]TWI55209.1 putative Zn-dependent peptidase [Halalkalibacter nanhaiisediminis]
MITRIELDNGVRILAENISTVRSISIGVWIGTGSRNERKHENGISHFLEHMFFKGTQTRSAADIAESFDRIGGQVNAFTSKEYTCYYAKVLDEHAEFAVDVLSDMFFNSVFDEEELRKEKNVVYEEIKMVDDTPDDIVHDLLSEASYGTHSLGFPILGTVSTLETFNGDTLREYMDRFYTGDHVVISVAGNISDEVIEQLKTIFADVSPTTYEHKDETPVFLPNTIVRKKETEQAHLCLGYPGLSIGEKDVYALVLLNNLLGGSMSSRLFQEIREKRGLCYSVFSYHSSYQDSGMLTVYAGTAHQQLDDLAKALQQTTLRLADEGMNEKELTNGKEQLKGSLMLSLESTNSRMTRNGKNELLLKKHRTLDEVLDEINSVSLAQVNTLAAAILNEKPSISLINTTGTLPEVLVK